MSNNLTLAEVIPVLNDLQTKLAGQNGNQVFDSLKKLLRGESPFPVQVSNASRLIIDLDSAPYIPDGWSVEEHNKGGVMEWDPTKVALHLDPDQKNGKWIEGNKLRKKLAKLNPYNANLLDFLLKKENQHLIPEEWKGKYIYFWGTIYRSSDGRLCVRYLFWLVGAWLWDYNWLGRGWDGGRPAAVPASQN